MLKTGCKLGFGLGSQGIVPSEGSNDRAGVWLIRRGRDDSARRGRETRGDGVAIAERGRDPSMNEIGGPGRRRYKLMG